MLQSLKVATLTAAIGGIKTYVNNPYSFSHGPLMMNDDERAKARVTEGLIRLRLDILEGETIILTHTRYEMQIHNMVNLYTETISSVHRWFSNLSFLQCRPGKRWGLDRRFPASARPHKALIFAALFQSEFLS